MTIPDELSDIDALAQLSFVVQQKLQRRVSGHDLSMIQIRLLGVLRDRHPTMKELGALLDLDKSSVSGLVVRAEQRDLVSRETDETDRRVIRVSLSPMGRRLVTEVSTGFDEDMNELLSPLSAADRRRLTGLIGRILPSQ
ncbi:MarR family transcriptional regulator [Gordonia sp. CPCC 205515]|uniref:MarR family winged helix-turn-helix transcriptional regulator n=1 Tax=Gordonia sp. CPCC 205515 TaxID=3140791 RepID=UPI003AF3E2A8